MKEATFGAIVGFIFIGLGCVGLAAVAGVGLFYLFSAVSTPWDIVFAGILLACGGFGFGAVLLDY